MKTENNLQQNDELDSLRGNDGEKKSFFKRHKILTFFLCLFLIFILAVAGIVLVVKIFTKPAIIRVTLTREAQSGAPFSIYVGSQAVDGSGDYQKLEKINDTTWEGRTKFGDEQELKSAIVLKASDEDLKVPSSSANLTPIQKRVNNEDFQRGALIVDYWSGEWNDQDIAKTDSDLKSSNIDSTWLAPAWDITSFDPIKIWNDEGGIIQYNETQLKNHISKLQSDGISVVMQPQLCCTPTPPEWTNKSTAWWDDFFKQYEAYQIYHAKIAEEMGVKVFVMSIAQQAQPQATGVPSDVNQRWSQMIDHVKSVYHGKLALFDYLWGSGDDPKGVAPLFQQDPAYLKKFDLFALSAWNPLTGGDNPTQELLDQKASNVLDNKTKPIFEKFNKPVLLETAYRSADGTNQGVSKYSVDLVSKNPDWKDYVKVELQMGGLFKSVGTVYGKAPIITYDGKEQAMVYEAYLKAISQRPWIIGLYPFVYHMKSFDFPRQPDYDIRRKPAEKILSEWYANFMEKLK